MSLQVFTANKVFAANKFGNVEDISNNKIIEKFIEPKTRKLSKSQKLSKLRKSKSKKLIKF